MTLYDDSGSEVTQLSATDSTWSAGGVGFFGSEVNSGATVYFDEAIIGDSGSGGGNVDSGLGTIDNFDDSSLGEYTVYREGPASIVSEPTANGAGALEIDGTTTEVFSMSGLPEYPAAGDTFSVRVRWTADANAVVLAYGVQSYQEYGDREYYYVIIQPDADQISLKKRDLSGKHSLDTNYEVGLVPDEWYELKVRWQADGTQTAALSEADGTPITQLIGNDDTWTEGGIGLTASEAYSGATVHFDELQGSSPTLGAFEAGVDGWSASGGNVVSQVSNEPAAVTEGSSALDVSVDSDPEPMVGNEVEIRSADFENYSCLLADVIPINVEGTDSPVTFRFRYHHTATGGVEESTEVTVDQNYGGIIAWDMSELSNDKLAAADRLEIAWYPDNHPPGSGFDHNGRVLIDNIYLCDDPNEVTQAAFFQKHRDLERAHGVRLEQQIDSQTEMTQDGVYRHDDGTDVSYHIELLDNGDIEETVDGETFRWAGGVQ